MNQNKKNILIVGASGVVGSEIAQLLKAHGHNVRSTTSKTAGAGQAQLNLVTGEGLKAAFEGIDRAFFLAPSGFGDQYKLLAPLVQEAKRRGLEKVVLMTAMGANAVDTAPLRKAEIDLEKSGLNYNIIRPNWFMQNFHTFWVHPIKTEGKVLLPAGTAKVSFIDTRDISAVAASLLIRDDLNNKDFDLTGPEAIDHAQVAALIAQATGKKVVYQESQPSELHKTLVGAGVPVDYADFLIMIFGFLREGYSAKITDTVEKITGKKPRAFAQYAKEFKNELV